MSNARIILKAVGEENLILNENPTHTFFKNEIRTYTQYGSGWIVITNNNKNTSNFVTPGSSIYFRIPVDGDIITETYLRIKINRSENWNSDNFDIRETVLGILESVEFRVHDTVLSRLEIDYIVAYLELICDWSELKNISDSLSYETQSNAFKDSPVQPNYLYLTLPLPFWFHKNPTLGMPVWSLDDANVGIKVETKNFNSVGNEILDIELLTQFIYLTQDEKLKFKNLPLEYVIEQPEKVDSKLLDKNRFKVNLTKTHFIKYLLWFIKDNESNQPFLYKDYLKNASIAVNGTGIVDEGDAKYYKLVERYKHFNSCGTLNLDSSNNPKEEINPIYIYSFAIEPSINKVSGFLTSDKFNNFTLECNLSNDAVGKSAEIYLVKHNIIRIHNGHLNVLFN
jgi:hypothetical protein